jgi:hypothetical protein
VRDYVYDPYPDIPRKIIGYKVEVVSPAGRRGERFEIRLGPNESMYKPDNSIGDEFPQDLP